MLSINRLIVAALVRHGLHLHIKLKYF